MEAGQELEALERLHLTIARQRICIRLCPRTSIPWDSMHTSAQEYFGIKRAEAEGLNEPRQEATREEILPDEEISDGRNIDPEAVHAEDEAEDEDRRLLLRQGSPSVTPYWIAEGDLTNEACCARLRAGLYDWHPSAHACGNVNKCLFCAAAAIKRAEDRDGYLDEEAVAALCIHSQGRKRAPIASDDITDNLIAFHKVLGKNKFQKYISHFGGLRVDETRVKALAAKGELHKVYTVMKIDAQGRLYFIVVEDPTNAIYSTWLRKIAGERITEWETTNDEVLADTVEAFLGLCYLTTVFPNYLLPFVPNPNEAWSRIESSMHFGADIRLYQFATTGTKRKSDKGPMMGLGSREVVQAMAKTIRSNPNFAGHDDGQWMRRVLPPDETPDEEP